MVSKANSHEKTENNKILGKRSLQRSTILYSRPQENIENYVHMAKLGWFDVNNSELSFSDCGSDISSELCTFESEAN